MASLLSARILGKIVDVRNIRMEKRGRIVSDIFCDGEDVNKWLLANYVV
jgi:endonuclease YncB( thermonuclease family)